MMKANRSKATESKGGVDLLSFLSTASDEKQETERARKAEETQSIGEDREADIRHFLRSKGGRATKTELYNWAKMKSVPPAVLYNVISKMVREGKVVRRFDENSQELVYELIE